VRYITSDTDASQTWIRKRSNRYHDGGFRAVSSGADDRIPDPVLSGNRFGPRESANKRHSPVQWRVSFLRTETALKPPRWCDSRVGCGMLETESVSAGQCFDVQVLQRGAMNMLQCLKLWAVLTSDRRAVTMLEYGLIAALIAVACIAAVSGLGTSLTSKFGAISSTV
jgi:pilus assembly protein Flp/PilA